MNNTVRLPAADTSVLCGMVGSSSCFCFVSGLTFLLGGFIYNNLTLRGAIYYEQNCTGECQRHIVFWDTAGLPECCCVH